MRNMPSTTPTHPDRVTSSPVSPPVIVGTNGEAGDKHEHPGQIDDRRYLRIVKMRLYKGNSDASITMSVGPISPTICFEFATV